MAYDKTTVFSTTSPAYEIGLRVQLYNHTSSHTHPIAHITPYLRRTNSSVVRYQHQWRVCYSVDHVHLTGLDYFDLLPDEARATGRMTMVAGQWYQWGPLRTVSIPNDGGIHYLGIRMLCVGTAPNATNRADLVPWCTIALGFPSYVAPSTPSTPSTPSAPPAPSGLKATFNEDTRQLTYMWNNTGSAYITIWSNHYTSDGRVLKQGWVRDANNNHIITAATSLTEPVADNIVRITYEMCNYNAAGVSTSSGERVLTVPEVNRIYTKIGGVWKRSTLYVKIGGVWKKVIRAYVKIGGQWKGV